MQRVHSNGRPVRARLARLGTAATLALIAGTATAQEMTDVGTPRADTLIVDMLGARVSNPTNMNMYQQGVILGQGLHQLALSLLWDIDTAAGEQIPVLADAMPEPLNDDFTRFRVPLKQGITWSDGEDFTADDVIFTDQMIRNTPELAFSAAYTDVIASMTKVDEHTIEIETTRPTPRLSVVLGSVIYGNSFYVVPQHVWEGENAATFTNFPPVTISAYEYSEHDPNGSWFLWEKRDDWQNTDIGQMVGEPEPDYVLFRTYGTEERRVLAMANNEMDILTDISPQSLDILLNQNENVRAWFPDFPYANLDDPCERGMHFNTAVAPYDMWQTRWALALAIDIERASIATFDGMMRASPLGVPPTEVLQNTYHEPMTEWLTEFELEDGYKPFNPDFATEMAERLRSEGIDNIPEDPEAQRELFGVGWWKHDPAQAEKLLLDAGFTKDGDTWMTPDGTPWTITLFAPGGFEVQSERLAYAVANEWTQFGVPTQVQPMPAGAFFTAENAGSHEVGSYWAAACAIIPDVFVNLEGWHEDYIREIGVPASANRGRYANPELSALIDRLREVPPDHPEITELGTEILKVLVEGMPAINMFGTSKFVPVNETYWTNYPTAENYYEGPWWWWSNFKFITAQLEPATAAE
ncbi:oligopeptide ABC transporter, periplasmic oligopeptide-binding protein [Oceanicola granulosus HTCC2516]|uniref:Oligopeptide ABC transporter, periplasmic oligopeptide-binding protein n=1 Tax=Oceanicola granulosus (strain ATCC BAA-861 / DSM 15982 / KCTC 12143 / HTCC2516) TaxID=314256 RepID=Q2CGU7_OCEGH|nr:ABC transporter substrate-binding protein [Oceanicola granulosus]EAR51838.1 oligopeptide ABC transporter, periplasmic oligopeptide-binding protein [Oceanicola granulosus HTCC2516]